MSREINPAYASVRVLIYVNDVPIGGQTNAQLTRTMAPIEITNKINKNWQRNLAGMKSWNLSCNGLIIADSQGYDELKTAFMEGNPVTIKFANGDEILTGQGLIISFPVDINYKQEYTYNVRFVGTGELI